MQTISVSQHGSKTEKNEDAYLVLDYQNLYLVADGVGGGPSGDFASRTLVDRVYSKFKTGKVDQDTLFALFRQISEDIHQVAGEKNLPGMATTFACAFLEDDSLTVLHAGDSRVYRLRGGSIKQLTNDHSKPVRKSDGSIKLMVTSVIGIPSRTTIDINHFDWREDDILLLTTDGITDGMEDKDINKILTNSNRLLSDRVNDLIEESGERGIRDDKTAILVFQKKAS